MLLWINAALQAALGGAGEQHLGAEAAAPPAPSAPLQWLHGAGPEAAARATVPVSGCCHREVHGHRAWAAGHRAWTAGHTAVLHP